MASKRQELIHDLDELVSKHVRRRDRKCFTCDKRQTEYNKHSFGNGHLIRRAILSLRWDVSGNGNCHLQCNRCNALHEVEPQYYIDAFIEAYGYTRYNELVAKTNELTNYKVHDLREKIKEIKEFTKNYKYKDNGRIT